VTVDNSLESVVPIGTTDEEEAEDDAPLRAIHVLTPERYGYGGMPTIDDIRRNVSILSQSVSGKHYVELPDDAEIVWTRFDITRNVYITRVTSDLFDVVPDGFAPPELLFEKKVPEDAPRRKVGPSPEQNPHGVAKGQEYRDRSGRHIRVTGVRYDGDAAEYVARVFNTETGRRSQIQLDRFLPSRYEKVEQE
jgi:hypothetical protein